MTPVFFISALKKGGQHYCACKKKSSSSIEGKGGQM